MSSSLPVSFQELFKLPNLGISPAAISFNTLTMESDVFMCVREQSGEDSSVSIIDIAKQSVSKHKIKADGAVMHPKSRVLALKAGTSIQIFNMEMKSKMKAHTTTEPVVFMKWISVKTLALVTETAVYHWSMEGESTPKKMFARGENMTGASIINYTVDPSEKWCLVTGITRSESGGAKGVIQLYSVDRGSSQTIDGHAAKFGKLKIAGKEANIICVAGNNAGAGQLHVMELPPPVAGFTPVKVPISFSTPQDFPVSMEISEKHGVIFMVTRSGYLYMFDAETGSLIFTHKISSDTIFLTTPHLSTGGFIGINRTGQVLLLSVNESTIVSYLKNQLSNMDLAIRIAVRAGLPGADDIFVSQFNRMLSEMKVAEAVKLAVGSPRGILRTKETLERLQTIPPAPGQAPAISLYFKSVMDAGSLNPTESVELAKLFVAKPGGVQKLQEMFDQGKLECTEELGDVVVRYDRDFAMKLYVKGNAPQKVILALAEKGAFQQIIAYVNKVGYHADFIPILTNLISVNPDGGVALAKMLAKNDPPLVDIEAVVDMFVQRTMIQPVTEFLFDVLKGDRDEHAHLQTKLMEINLMYSPPSIADRLLGSGMFTKYDKELIARQCEKVHLYNRAMENYSSIDDIKRVIVNTQAIDPNFLVGFFGRLSPEESLICLRELLRTNMRQNAQLVTQIATKYSEELSPESIVELFETYKCFEGMFYYLGSVISSSQDPVVHFKYIEAATKCGQFAEVERVTRESDYYDPEQTKEFLKEAKLPDQWALINVCDKHNFIEEMVQHLYETNQLKFLDAFLMTRNPLRTPVVIGTLIDLDAREEYIKNLVLNVGSMCPVEPLVEEAEKRNRMKLLLPWLEAREKEGSQEPSLHNALAMVYIDLSREPEKFLKSNEYYDSRVVGKYCEKRDPHLAYIAYKRGQCDYELVGVCQANGMFRQEARYLVERQNQELWQHVLKGEEKARRHLIDAVVQYALPESRHPEEVSSTVKAFMSADLPSELIELLEKIVLQGNSEFKKNSNLQNLLILTAIKADHSRVMGYINRLDNYDGAGIAAVAKNAGLFEEAFSVFKKFNLHEDAVDVLLDDLTDMERALDFAERVDETAVWSKLGSAQLANGMVAACIDSFLKAEEVSSYVQVVQIAEREKCFAELVKFLQMARGKVKDSQIDSELIYAFAKIDALAELEEFVSGPNQAKIQLIGDRCFDEGLYEAARILFDSVSNFPRLASCYVRLEQYQAAVEAARKASSTKTWKEVNFACVDAQEFRLAQMCGLNIIIHADELEELCDHYERQGYFEELIHLLEAGLPLERSHMGLFTELGRLYSRYMPEKLMEHIRVNYKKINIPRLIRACELDHHWEELRILYMHDEQFENAIEVMIHHPTQAFDHSVFKEIIVKCKSGEIYHKSIGFYLMHEPDLLVNLLLAISHLLDHARVVTDIRRAGELSLIKPYMERVQEHNISIVNESLNEVYVKENDYKNLRKSVDLYDKFDQIGLAQRLEKHELLEFRRISAYLFKKNDRFEESIGLSKKDKLYKDAMETAAESKSRDLAEGLLRFFVENEDSSCFLACMFTCYDLIRPDVVMELAWKHKLTDVAMPYMIQVIREYTQKVDVLERERQERIEEKKKKEEEGDEGSAEAQAAAALSSTMPGLLGIQMTGMVPDAPLPFMQTGVPFMRGPYPGQY